MEEETKDKMLKPQKWDVAFTMYMSREMRDFIANEVADNWDTDSSSMYIRKLIKREMEKKATQS